VACAMARRRSARLVALRIGVEADAATMPVQDAAKGLGLSDAHLVGADRGVRAALDGRGASAHRCGHRHAHVRDVVVACACCRRMVGRQRRWEHWASRWLQGACPLASRRRAQGVSTAVADWAASQVAHHVGGVYDVGDGDVGRRALGRPNEDWSCRGCRAARSCYPATARRRSSMLSIIRAGEAFLSNSRMARRTT
jgi:hypothetical protein